MLLKKFVLEFGTLVGLVGGGSGGIIGSSSKSIEVHYGDDSTLLSESTTTLVHNDRVNQDLKKRNGLISHLNHNVLNYGRGQSEGIGEDFLFINGGAKAGKPIEISSKAHSQKKRELGGGRLIAFGNYDGGGFGSRDVTKFLRDLEKASEVTRGQSYGPIIQESGKYLTQQDGEEMTQFGYRRSEELEENIFGLGKGREYGIKQFGTNKDGKVDLEFRLDSLGRVLRASEDDLRVKGGKYGEIVRNSFLDSVRYFGDLEGTAFNYLRKIAGPDDENTKKLREKNIAKVIQNLIYGEEMGFKCNREDLVDLKNKYFEECERGSKEKLGNFEIVSVLKATNESEGYYRVPTKEKGPLGKDQLTLENSEVEKLINFEKLEESKLIFEKCEKNNVGFDWLDTNKKIRQEACEKLLNPGFGDSVEDKRLCLFKSSDNNYLLRLINYIKVITIPTGHQKNTFGTKCSNFGI